LWYGGTTREGLRGRNLKNIPVCGGERLTDAVTPRCLLGESLNLVWRLTAFDC
jgi:hypothetical protein